MSTGWCGVTARQWIRVTAPFARSPSDLGRSDGGGLTGRHSLKSTPLAANAFVSLAYTAEHLTPVYVECQAFWEDDRVTKQRLGELFLHTPPPLGYDPAHFLWQAESPESGVLRLLPWRIELADLFTPQHVKIWQTGG